MKNYEDVVGNIAVGNVKSTLIKWHVKRPQLNDNTVSVVVRYHYETTSGFKGNDIEFDFKTEEIRNVFPDDSWDTAYRMVNVVGALADTRDRCHKHVENLLLKHIAATRNKGEDSFAEAEWRFLQPDAQEFVRIEALVEAARISTNMVVCFQDVKRPNGGVRY